MKTQGLYAGVDIHKDVYVGKLMDDKGDIVFEKSFKPTLDGAKSFLCNFPIKIIGFEACGMARAAKRLFTELGHEVKVGNPNKIKNIVGCIKTDKIDAGVMAHLLRVNYFPEVYIPNDEVQKLRDLTRHKSTLTRLQTRVKNQIKSHLLREGIQYPKKLWSVLGTQWLSELEDPIIHNFINVLQSIGNETNNTLKNIKKISKSRRLTNLLMTMPGIAEYSALMIFAEIADITRFKTPQKLIMYAGLCPGTHQSDKTEYNVKNFANNKNLKWILYECSGRASLLKGTIFQKHFAKINQKKGYRIARRSTARKMLIIIWHMLSRQEPFNAQ